MRLSAVARRDGVGGVSPLVVDESFYGLFYGLLSESQQAEYLAKKYPEVDTKVIQQAVDLDRRNAEKLVFGLQTGVIRSLDADSVAAVAGLDPFAKGGDKSESDLGYEAAIKRAKAVNPRYWQWVLRQQKDDPEAGFDEGLFHYLEGEGVSDEELKKLSLKDVRERSEKWHDEQFVGQSAQGQYKLGPDSEGVTPTGPFFWVPVDAGDAVKEGAKMQNCIGRYCNPSSSTKIFSMRNKFNNPHVSMSVVSQQNVRSVGEIKGKQNKQPVDKYVPFIEEFVSKLVKKGAKIGAHSDFWQLPIEADQYVDYVVGDVSVLYPKVSDGKLNELVVKNGLARAAPEIVARLSPEVVTQLLQYNPGATNWWDASEFMKLAISNRKVSEEQVQELATKGVLPRDAMLVAHAVFNPEAFVAELEKAIPEDLAAAWSNYKSAIAAFPGRHEVFMKIAEKLMMFGNRNSEVMKTLYMKSPARLLIRLLASVKSRPDTLSVLVSALMPELTGEDFETKYYILSLIPNAPVQGSGEWDDGSGIAMADKIVYSTALHDLPKLYNLKIPALNARMQNLMVGVKAIAAEAGQYPQMAGLAAQFVKDADMVLDTDDVDELREFRRLTKSRGVKKLIDRKIARMEKLANAV